MKFYSLLVLSCLLVAVAARAEDDDATETAGGRPEAAAAARDKGYRAETAAPGVVPGDEEEPAAIERHAAPGSSNALQSAPPPQRKLGPAPGNGAGAGGGATGGGLSCDKTAPALKTVHHKALPNLASMLGRVFDYQMAPNEAMSFKFTAPKSGAGGFYLNETTAVPAVMAYATISSVPCDFQTSGGLDPNGVIADACHIGRVFPNVSFTVNGTGKVGTGCPLKPGGTYYFNIRFLQWTGEGKNISLQDSCAALIKQFGPGANGKCGGLFTYNGSVDAGSPADASAIRRDMFLK